LAEWFKVSSNKLTLAGSTNNGTGAQVIVNAGTLVLAKSSSASVHAVGSGQLSINAATVQLAGTATTIRSTNNPVRG